MKQKRIIVLSAAALILVSSITIQSAMAYFTTYVSAKGSHVVRMGAQTTITEELSQMTKHISVQNASSINDCYVRVKVFCGSQIDINISSESGLWEQRGNDGYWYYIPIVPAGTATEILDAKINVPEGYEESFNVAVVQECTPVVFDEDGNATADWNANVYSGTDNPGEEEGGK